MTDPRDYPAHPIAGDPLACTIADVAAIIRARTKDSSGNEVGNFTDDTRPTDQQAQEAIDHQVAAVHRAVGVVGPGCIDLAQIAVAYGAAAEIELSYFPEQARADRSPYTYLVARAQELLDGVAQCVQGNLPSAPTPDDPGANERFGTLGTVMSGTVHDFYARRGFGFVLPVPEPDPPDPDA